MALVAAAVAVAVCFALRRPVQLAVDVAWTSGRGAGDGLPGLVVLVVGVAADGGCGLLGAEVVGILRLDVGEGWMALVVAAEGVVELSSGGFDRLAVGMLVFGWGSVLLGC